MNSFSLIDPQNILKCCTSNELTRKITYDAGVGTTYQMFMCEEHYKLPANQLFILKEEKI